MRGRLAGYAPAAGRVSVLSRGPWMAHGSCGCRRRRCGQPGRTPRGPPDSWLAGRAKVPFQIRDPSSSSPPGYAPKLPSSQAPKLPSSQAPKLPSSQAPKPPEALLSLLPPRPAGVFLFFVLPFPSRFRWLLESSPFSSVLRRRGRLPSSARPHRCTFHRSRRRATGSKCYTAWRGRFIMPWAVGTVEGRDVLVLGRGRSLLIVDPTVYAVHQRVPLHEEVLLVGLNGCNSSIVVVGEESIFVLALARGWEGGQAASRPLGGVRRLSWRLVGRAASPVRDPLQVSWSAEQTFLVAAVRGLFVYRAAPLAATASGGSAAVLQLLWREQSFDEDSRAATSSAAAAQLGRSPAAVYRVDEEFRDGTMGPTVQMCPLQFAQMAPHDEKVFLTAQKHSAFIDLWVEGSVSAPRIDGDGNAAAVSYARRYVLSHGHEVLHASWNEKCSHGAGMILSLGADQKIRIWVDRSGRASSSACEPSFALWTMLDVGGHDPVASLSWVSTRPDSAVGLAASAGTALARRCSPGRSAQQASADQEPPPSDGYWLCTLNGDGSVMLYCARQVALPLNRSKSEIVAVAGGRLPLPPAACERLSVNALFRGSDSSVPAEFQVFCGSFEEASAPAAASPAGCAALSILSVHLHQEERAVGYDLVVTRTMRVPQAETAVGTASRSLATVRHPRLPLAATFKPAGKLSDVAVYSWFRTGWFTGDDDGDVGGELPFLLPGLASQATCRSFALLETGIESLTWICDSEVPALLVLGSDGSAQCFQVSTDLAITTASPSPRNSDLFEKLHRRSVGGRHSCEFERPSDSEAEYEVNLVPHPEFGIGLHLAAEDDGSGARVSGFKTIPDTDGKLPAQSSGMISIGDILVSINRHAVDGLSLEATVQVVRMVTSMDGTEEHGITLRFRTQNDTDMTDDLAMLQKTESVDSTTTMWYATQVEDLLGTESFSLAHSRDSADPPPLEQTFPFWTATGPVFRIATRGSCAFEGIISIGPSSLLSESNTPADSGGESNAHIMACIVNDAGSRRLCAVQVVRTSGIEEVDICARTLTEVTLDVPDGPLVMNVADEENDKKDVQRRRALVPEVTLWHALGGQGLRYALVGMACAGRVAWIRVDGPRADGTLSTGLTARAGHYSDGAVVLSWFVASLCKGRSYAAMCARRVIVAFLRGLLDFVGASSPALARCKEDAALCPLWAMSDVSVDAKRSELLEVPVDQSTQVTDDQMWRTFSDCISKRMHDLGVKSATSAASTSKEATDKGKTFGPDRAELLFEEDPPGGLDAALQKEEAEEMIEPSVVMLRGAIASLDIAPCLSLSVLQGALTSPGSDVGGDSPDPLAHVYAMAWRLCKELTLASNGESDAGARPPTSIPDAAILSALLCSSQDSIVDEFLADFDKMCSNALDVWEVAKLSGAPLWIRREDHLLRVADALASAAARKHNGGDPLPAALFLACAGKTTALHALARADRESKYGPALDKLLRTHGPRFDSERARNAASKNAFALLSKRQYMGAAALFLLPSEPLVTESLNVLKKHLDDPVLMLFVSRVMEARSTPSNRASTARAEEGREEIAFRYGPITESVLRGMKGSHLLVRTGKAASSAAPSAASFACEALRCVWLGEKEAALSAITDGRKAFSKPRLVKVRHPRMRGWDSPANDGKPRSSAVGEVWRSLSSIVELVSWPLLVAQLSPCTEDVVEAQLQCATQLWEGGAGLGVLELFSLGPAFNNIPQMLPQKKVARQAGNGSFSALLGGMSKRTAATTPSTSASTGIFGDFTAPPQRQAAGSAAASIFDDFTVPAPRSHEKRPVRSEPAPSIFDGFDAAPQPARGTASPAPAAKSIFDDFATAPQQARPTAAAPSIFDGFDAAPQPARGTASPAPAAKSIFDDFATVPQGQRNGSTSSPLAQESSAPEERRCTTISIPVRTAPAAADAVAERDEAALLVSQFYGTQMHAAAQLLLAERSAVFLSVADISLLPEPADQAAFVKVADDKQSTQKAQRTDLVPRASRAVGRLRAAHDTICRLLRGRGSREKLLSCTLDEALAAAPSGWLARAGLGNVAFRACLFQALGKGREAMAALEEAAGSVMSLCNDAAMGTCTLAEGRSANALANAIWQLHIAVAAIVGDAAPPRPVSSVAAICDVVSSTRVGLMLIAFHRRDYRLLRSVADACRTDLRLPEATSQLAAVLLRANEDIIRAAGFSEGAAPPVRDVTRGEVNEEGIIARGDIADGGAHAAARAGVRMGEVHLPSASLTPHCDCFPWPTFYAKARDCTRERGAARQRPSGPSRTREAPSAPWQRQPFSRAWRARAGRRLRLATRRRRPGRKRRAWP